MLNVLSGKQNKARRMMVVGVPGVGKSTLAAQSPKPVFIPTEDGIDDLDVPHFPKPSTFSETLNNLQALGENDHDFKTIVVDTIDWLERLIHNQICEEQRVESIEKASGEYGKGYVLAARLFDQFLDACDWLRESKKMHVIFLAHARAERFADPEHSDYDRYAPKLHKLISARCVEWCDEVLFANFKTFTKETNGAFGKTAIKAVGSGERILRTTAKPTCIAKNRLALPDELPLAWEPLANFYN